jgi:FkbM family methyltransferase
VGANIGQFTIAAVNIFTDSKIYAFEPNPGPCKKLMANTTKFSNIEIFHYAVGNKNTQHDFHIHQHDQTSSILNIKSGNSNVFPDLKEIKTINVTMTTLDSIFYKRTLKRPVLLKLDVQGCENRVVEGAQKILKNVDFVVMETSFRPMYSKEPPFLELVELMNASNFRFSRPVSFFKNPQSGEILQADVLFENTDITVRNP